MSWILNWFNNFSFNRPKWVYVQYINLYINWLDWWKGTVKISNLSTESIPSIYNNSDSMEGTSGENSSNKWINKKNIIIGVTVIALIGVGIWYLYYSGSGNGNGGAGNGGTGNVNPVFVPNPPTPNPNSIPHQISVIDNQTPDPVPVNQSNPLLNSNLEDYNPERLNQTELDRVRQARIEHLRQDRVETILNQERLNTPSTSTPNVSSSSINTLIPSINTNDHPST